MNYEEIKAQIYSGATAKALKNLKPFIEAAKKDALLRVNILCLLKKITASNYIQDPSRPILKSQVNHKQQALEIAATLLAPDLTLDEELKTAVLAVATQERPAGKIFLRFYQLSAQLGETRVWFLEHATTSNIAAANYKHAAITYGILAQYYKTQADTAPNAAENKRLLDLFARYRLLAAETAIHPDCPAEQRDYLNAAWSYDSLAQYYKILAEAETDETEKKKLYGLYAQYKLLSAENNIHPNCAAEQRDYCRAALTYGGLAHDYRTQADTASEAAEKQRLFGLFTHYQLLSAGTAIHPDCPAEQRDYPKARQAYFYLIEVMLCEDSDENRVNDIVDKLISLPFKYITPRNLATIGGVYGRLGDPEMALCYIDAAFHIETNCDRAFYELGLLHQQEEDWTRAQESFAKAVEFSIDDKYPDGLPRFIEALECVNQMLTWENNSRTI